MEKIITVNSDEEKFVLSDLELLLQKRRGYIFNKPSKDEGIVFIVSGGLDSITATFRVLNEMECVVYPLYIRRGARSEQSELKSIKFYLEEFSKRFGDRIKPIEFIDAEVPPKSIKPHIPKSRLSTIGHPMRNAILQSYAIQYAVAMSYRDSITIKTVYTAISPDDMLPHCSLVALRAETILACIDAGDWDWQITSPILEPSLWGVVHKTDSILYAHDNKLSLDHTYTCTQQPEIACGVCPECHLRLKAFEKASLQDPIQYAQ